MEANQIVFDGKSYKIIKTLYRTMGSFNQRLLTTKTAKAELRRTFYVVEHNGQLFWVKEYTEPTSYQDIDYEFAETNRLHSATCIGSHDIRTVEMFCVENGRLLMEYCADYVKIQEASLTPQQKTIVIQLVTKWLREHPTVHNYDMCGNNILVRSGDNISIRLIDFEYSLKMSRIQWEQTRNAECWYKEAGTIVFSGSHYDDRKGKKK